MIKKLRIKLIAASMASLFLVLFVIGGIVGILNYKKIIDDADQILEVLEETEKMTDPECHRKFLMSPDIFQLYLMKMEISF